VRSAADIFNVQNRVNYTCITTRALPGEDRSERGHAADLSGCGNGRLGEAGCTAFGTYTAASSNLLRERQVQIGFKMEF